MMQNSILDFFIKSENFNKILNETNNNSIISVHSIAEGHYAFLASALYLKNKRPMLIISSNDIKASKIAKDIEAISNNNCIVLPARDKQFSRVAASQDSTWERISALIDVASNSLPIISCSIEAACDIQAPLNRLKEFCFTLKTGDIINPNDLIEKLLKLGYERVSMVEGKGQCALRGDILDIFSSNKNSAIRIEFFDDEIDTIRGFDCISQRSINTLNECSISPASECLPYPNEINAITKRLQKAIDEPSNISEISSNESFKLDEAIFVGDDNQIDENVRRRRQNILDIISNLKLGYPPSHTQTLLHLLYSNKQTILDYLVNPIIILVEPDNLKQRQNAVNSDYQEDFVNAYINGFAFMAQKDLLTGYTDFYNSVNQLNSCKILFSDLKHGLGMFKPNAFIEIESLGVSPYQSQIKLFEKDIKRYLSENYNCFIYAGSNSRAERILKTLQAYDIKCTIVDQHKSDDKSVGIIPNAISTGFIWSRERLLIYSDGDVYGSSYKKLKKKYQNSEKIASYTELFKGDYVVHESYGVGVFGGIESIERNGSTQEYLLIEYAGSDKLYVPTEQFDRVQKFASSQSTAPHINKLGGTEWQKKKSKVKSSLKQLAFSLLALYAQREQNQGFAFSRDNPWQLEFDDNFPYELTPDQETCLKEIYEDMNSHKTMDRLLCGDVGYGKTELALRAAFKAVADSKQVAILAPTTILAQQHYQTIIKRFSHFPVNCDMLSRFKTTKEQKSIINSLENGTVDIVVGTHKLLSKDVKFKNLGLLIVDEEQRFGVGHKEIIKNLKANIDVLTLTATPIPRTLYMSMIGVRDISIIETPPEDRLTVKTYVVEYSDSILKDAIVRELNRGGQVYVLYNRVEYIDRMSQKIKALVPEARIGIAHGQMKESTLETTMINFYNGNYDVLLCSTIIENGLDVAEANTLIIIDADKFGLSQLYQLRGRVGRSSRQAYAYFTIRPNYEISEVAQKRLMAIREFTEFGAGYRIAMRDLEIRGAGNIFGPEQSGHLTDIGFDMYLKLVEQAMNEAQGKPLVPDDIDTRIILPLDSYLPQNYVVAEKERIEIYKRISMVKDMETKMDIEEELVDRYGTIPIEVENLTMIAYLRACTRKLFVSLLKAENNAIIMNIDINKIKDPLLLVEAIKNSGDKLVLKNTKPYGIIYKYNDTPLKQAILHLMPLLQNAIDHIEINTKKE